jgi:hypothetical protein
MSRSPRVLDRRLARGAFQDRFLHTSPMALVMRISRGHASVQFKIVRQRHTPSRSFRISSRSSAATSRLSKMKRWAFTMAVGRTKFSSAQKLGPLVLHAAHRMHFVELLREKRRGVCTETPDVALQTEVVLNPVVNHAR